MKIPTLELLFTHIIEGYDIPTPAATVKVSAERAAIQHPGVPYSLLTNLAHTVLWQDIWLQGLAGGKGKGGMQDWKNDWRVPDPSEWEALRKRFLEGLKAARAYCQGTPHQAESDEKAADLLIRIAVHASYHVGQMALLKRIK